MAIYVSQMGNFFAIKAEPSKVVTQDIEGAIFDIGELSTSEYRYTISQVFEKPSKTIVGLDIPFTDSRVLYSYIGVIKAGIQFAEIDINVSEADKAIYIQLPEAEILSEEVFQDSFLVYDASYSLLNTVTFEDMNLSIQTLKETAKDEAIANGLLQAAQTNASQILLSTINSFKDRDDYTVEFY